MLMRHQGYLLALSDNLVGDFRLIIPKFEPDIMLFNMVLVVVSVWLLPVSIHIAV